MKLAALLLLLPLLAGCPGTAPTKPDQPAVIQYKYVVTKIPDELFKRPEGCADIDTKVATDKDAAKWMIECEKRNAEIERRLDRVKRYQDEKLKSLSVPEADIIRH